RRRLRPGRGDADHPVGHQLPASRGQHLSEARADPDNAQREDHLRPPVQQGRGEELASLLVTTEITDMSAGGPASTELHTLEAAASPNQAATPLVSLPVGAGKG